jgi:hypothetical protein
MATTFSWKPALAVGRTTAEIDASGVTLIRGKKRRRVDFADVSGVRLVEIVGRQSSTSLVLLTEPGKTILHCGASLALAEAGDANARSFVSACAAVLDALARARPDIQVSHGGAPVLRATMSAMGALIGLFGAAVAILSLAGSGLGEQVFGVLSGGVMAYVGGRMAISFNPFRAPPELPADATARTLAAFAGLPSVH